MHQLTRMPRRGFTIVELLIALLLAGFVGLVMIGLLNITSRNFRVHDDAIRSLDQLTYAMNLVKDDMRRAGYLAVPNADIVAALDDTTGAGTRDLANQSCRSNRPGEALRAVTLSNGGSPATLTTLVSGRAPDRLTLFGSYRVDEPFAVYSATPTQLRLNSLGTLANARIGEFFNRTYVALVNDEGGTLFIRTGTWSSADPTAVPLEPNDFAAVGGSRVCNFNGLGSRWTVAPVTFVRYELQNGTEPGETVLVRSEFGRDATPINSVVVARNVVDFQVWFDGRDPLDPRGIVVPDAFSADSASQVLNDDLGSMALNTLDGSGGSATAPERIRLGYVQISVRLRNQTQGLAREGSGTAPHPDGLYFTYDVDGDANSSAQIVTMRGEVELYNISVAGQ